MGISLLSVLLLLIKLIHCGQAKEKPTLTVNPYPTVYNGEPLTLTCDLKISHTGWKFMWYNVSHQLERLTPEYKNTNTLSITASDKGTAEYQCSARIGENDTDYSDPVKITVKKHEPTLRVNPNTTVYTGETFTLTCDLKSSYTGWVFTWYKVSKALESMKEKGPNTFNITASDTGSTEYVCIAYREVNGSDYGSEYSNTVKITVAEKPKPSLRVDPHTTVYTGDTLTLTCDLKVSHTGWKFMWFRVSQQLQPLTPEYKTTNTLSITASDTAEYQCSALRGENSDTDLSDPIKITVKTGPLNIGLAVGSSLFILIIIILGLFWCYKKNKGGGNPGLPANQQNTSQKQNVAGPGDSVSIPLQSGEPSDVTYAEIDLKPKEKKASKGKTSADTDQETIYSKLK